MASSIDVLVTFYQCSMCCSMRLPCGFYGGSIALLFWRRPRAEFLYASSMVPLSSFYGRFHASSMLPLRLFFGASMACLSISSIALLCCLYGVYSVLLRFFCSAPRNGLVCVFHASSMWLLLRLCRLLLAFKGAVFSVLL